MNTSGDSADRVVQLSLEGFEVMLRLSGAGAKEVIAMIYSVLKDKEKNSIGKTNLLNMMKNCKEIKIFTMKKSDLERFSEEAKKYGILYCVLMDKDNKSKDGMIDIMVRGEDAPKVNRIVERYNLSISEPAALRDIQVKEKEELEVKKEISKGNENQINDIMNSIVEVDEKEFESKEEKAEDGVSKNFLERENQLETSLESKGEVEDGRISVKEELKKNKEKIKNTKVETSKKKERAKKEKSKKKKGVKKNGRDR